MKRRAWLLSLLAILSVMLMVINTGLTSSLFTDDEPSTNNPLSIRWGLFTLNDGFETTGAAWDDYWDENGATTWIQDAGQKYSGTYSAGSISTNKGYLTSDEIEASTASNITVSFWIYIKSLEATDAWIQTYNGTAYNNWYDATAIGTNNVWVSFSQVITDPQYRIAGFRLRFDTSLLANANDIINIDGVVITTDTIPPAVPTGLTATPGNEQISLDWNNNSEPDLWGYNVYRSTVSGGPYTKINTSPVPNSNYIDSGLYGGGTYYYVVRAIDYGNNESGNSNESSATAVNIAPAAPTSLNATAGNEQISLDWNDNIETDLAGYNVYRSLTSGGSYSQINGSLVSTSNYTNTGLYGGGSYYYKVTAVDNVSAESGYSSVASATAVNVAPAAPTGLAATPGNEQVSLSWNSNNETDLAGYNVYRGTVSGGPYSQINGSPIASSNYTDTPLYGGGTFYYVVRAEDNGSLESGNSNEASATAVNIAPAVPTGLAATPGNEQISLDWNDNIETDLAGYNIYRSTVSGGPYSKINGSPVVTSSYTNTGLYGGGTFYYVVRAQDNGSLESGNSNQASATAVNVAPAVPTSVNATAGNEQITLDWNDNIETDLAGYNIYRSAVSGGPYTKINGSLVTSSNYTNTGLYGGGTFYYVVRAQDNGSLESGNSNEASATAVNIAPAVPTSVNATTGNEQITLDWNDNTEPDLAGYNVYRGTASGGPYSKINGSLVTSSNYTNTGLYGGGTFYYVVRAQDNGSLESGNSNEANATTVNIAPAAPTGLTATPGDGLVNLNWNDNSEPDLAGYNIYRSLVSGNYTQIVSLWTSSNYTNTGLTGNVTYYYVVRAQDNGSLESGNSNEASATPFDNPPAAPTGLVATRGNQKVTLDWNDNTEGDLAGYNIYRGTTSGNYTQIASLVTSSNYTNTGLTANVTYYYAVKAVDLGNNLSGYSNEASATPWTPVLWTQTSQADFEAGVLTSVNTTSSPGNVRLALIASNVTVTNSPTTNTGAAWTNPTNAYGDVGGAATITSGAPSGSNVWGTYGFSATADAITQVRVRYDAWSAGTPLAVTLRAAGANANGTTSVAPAQPTGTATNDVLVAFILDHSTTNAQSAAPTGWQGRGYAWTSDRRFQVFTAVVGQNGLTGTSWTFSGLTTRAQGMIIGYYNADTTGYGGLDTTVSVRSNASGTYGTLGITTATNNAMIVAAFSADSKGVTWSGETTATAGALTERFDVANSNFCSIAVADKLLATAGATGASTATPSAADTNGGIMLALKPIIEYNDQIKVDVSWNGGTSWSATANTTLTSAQTTYWYDVTSATTWTPAKLADGQLQVRALAQTVNNTEVVNLDWLPVEVTYQKYAASGTIASQVLDTTVTGSEWAELAWDGTLPAGTGITFEVRASDTAFLKTDASPSWTSVGGTSPVISGLPAGRYKQWRATLTPDGAQTSTSILPEVRVYYDGG